MARNRTIAEANRFAEENIVVPTYCSRQLKQVQFQAFGKVQKVHFRIYTQAIAKHLGLTGWVMNTRNKAGWVVKPGDRTVVGVAQGSPEQLRKLFQWMRYTGTPKSKVNHVSTKNVREIPARFFKTFEIKL